MSIDILKFVNGCRHAYKFHYLANTQSVVKGEVFTVSSFDKRDNINLPNGRTISPQSTITIDFAAPPDPAIWSTNVVENDKVNEDVYHGYIHVDPNILDQNPEYQKFILAEEWLEVMLGICFPTDRKRAKKTSKRIDMIELFNYLGRRTLWKDDDEDLQQIHLGLQHLLVSDKSVEIFLESNYSISLNQLRSLANNLAHASEAGELIRSVERSFSANKRVQLELVQLRLNQILFEQWTDDELQTESSEEYQI